jgi:hypothetical protein
MRTKRPNIAKTHNFGYILVNKDANRVGGGSVSCLLILKMRAHGLDRMRTKAPPRDRATTLQISFKANCKGSHTHTHTHHKRNEFSRCTARVRDASRNVGTLLCR